MPDKKEYIMQIRRLIQVLNYGLVLKKIHKFIKFHQEAWLKSHMIMNAKLRKKGKNDFEKDLLQLMNNSVWAKS